MLLRGTLEALPWESEFFAISTARLSAIGGDQPDISSEQLGSFQRIQAKVSAADYDAILRLQQYGFAFVEGELDFFLPLTERSTTVVEPDYDLALATDISDIRAIAAEAFSLSRFRAPWYSVDDSRRFYALWAEKAVHGTFDHHCLIIRDQQKHILGLVTLRELDNHEMRIGLLAVAATMRHQHLGARLMQSAMHWCQQQKKVGLWVATQSANLAAVRLYQKSGAMITTSHYWFYR